MGYKVSISFLTEKLPYSQIWGTKVGPSLKNGVIGGARRIWMTGKINTNKQFIKWHVLPTLIDNKFRANNRSICIDAMANIFISIIIQLLVQFNGSYIRFYSRNQKIFFAGKTLTEQNHFCGKKIWTKKIIFGRKNLWLKKSFGRKNLWKKISFVWKNIWLKKILAEKSLPEKSFGRKNLWMKKVLGEKISGWKKFWPKNLSLKKVLAEKILGWKKFWPNLELFR